MRRNPEMDIQQAIATRRTVHRYRPGAPEDLAQIVDRALTAACWAPCHKKTWPWQFTLVGPQTREQLADLQVDIKRPQPAGVAATRAKITAPAALIVVSQRASDDAFRAREDYAAIACAIQNLMLSLHADGLYSKWSTGGLSRDPRLASLIALPEGYEVIGLVWAGWAETVPVAPPRTPLSEVVRRLP